MGTRHHRKYRARRSGAARRSRGDPKVDAVARLSVHEAARRLGKDTGYLENRLFLLKAPDDVREMVSARADSVRHAREIAKVENPKARQRLIEAAVAGAPFAAIQERVRSTLEAAVRQLALGLPSNKHGRN